MPRNPVPFGERNTKLRKPLDICTGRYPTFLYGAKLGSFLPVFSFEKVTLPYLEPYLVYLMENGYQTLQTPELQDIVLGKRKIDAPSVVLQFDGAWASVWTVVAPLLRRYNMRAVTFAIPGRIQHGEKPRPTWRQPGHDPAIDHTQNPFCTWEELRALADEGRVDVQSHSWSHAQIFCSDQFQRLILPETDMPLLEWPVISDPGEPLKRLGPSNVFHPLLPTRTRLSNALKHDVDPSVVRRIHDDPNAAPYLFRQYFLQIETEEDREKAIRFELEQSKGELEDKLGKPVTQIRCPRGICGGIAESLLHECGYETAVADKLGGFRACVPGQNPRRIMRLDHIYIPCLPGRTRKCYWYIK
ncbi:MAG: polysaccharide deacetylase family protein [Verrucomicrobia bacterium]|nr:polysaccharide deacetylase family protein [Verrucomicrobiota bacterium]MCH8511924.1 polysaccharide deacetylase family protein [Kiritimatiellia bacterium]